ncbi:MAG: alkaline phosphatase D family protein [Cyclobacteriaceae bacterium]
MKRLIFIPFLCILCIAYSCKKTPASNETAEKTSLSIAFGSCNKPEIDGRMWQYIGQNNPDLFVWLGDIVYGDTHNMDTLRAKYNKLSQMPAYRQFADSTPIIGVWDDHDYGVNDAGKYYSKKEESKSILLDFLEVAKDAEVYQHAGVYSSEVMGSGDRKVKIILLDGRSFRDTLAHSDVAGRRYEANPEGDILGEAQWKWLENELTDSDAKVHIIGCGIQFIATAHGWEKWANFPKARKRLFDLLSEKQPASPVLISGDRHIAEIAKIEIDNYSKPVYELTASGLTHTWSEVKKEPNQYRTGKLIAKRNFGLIKVQWTENNDPQVTLEVRGLENELYESKTLWTQQ